jgi:hypothetical protein
MSDSAQLPCLGCGKTITVPKRLAQMAERYEGRPVAFCSKPCNLKWITAEGLKGQEQQMRDLIERLEKEGTES